MRKVQFKVSDCMHKVWFIVCDCTIKNDQKFKITDLKQTQILSRNRPKQTLQAKKGPLYNI